MIVLAVLGILALGLVYVWPSIAALGRDHNHTIALIITNLLLGWTIVGWLVCYIWAYVDVNEEGDRL